MENEHACNIGTAAESAKLLNAVVHPESEAGLGSGECVRRRREPVPLRVRFAAEGPYRTRPREGLPHGRPQADLGACGESACGLEGADCGSDGRRI
jgi:hypothetical protein